MLIFSGDSRVDVKEKATCEIRKLVKFFNYRKLSINFKKTHFMNFSIYNDENNFDEL